jgi:hypothetical protein
MRWSYAFIGVLAIGFAASGLLFGDDQDSKKDPGKAVRIGTLPPNYSKLGLSDDQKKKIREVQAEYRAKIVDLEDQIKELRKKEKAAMEQVLTDTQRAHLRELVLEKAPAEKQTSK